MNGSEPDVPRLDEQSLRRLLADVTAGEPPLGPVAHNALLAGMRLRRRHRKRQAVVVAGVAGVVTAAVPVLAGLPGGTRPSGGRTAAPPPAVYVAFNRGNPEGAVKRIPVASGIPGRPVRAGVAPFALAATPDGKTVYAADFGSDTVTPISTATSKAGKPIKVGRAPMFIAVTPNGRTAYVTGLSGDVTPIATASNKAGKPIFVDAQPGPDHPGSMVISPDGRTVYVPRWVQARGPNSGWETHSITPISTATNTAGKPIPAPPGSDILAVTPDGKTLYALSAQPGTLTPIRTATQTAGRPIRIGRHPSDLVVAPGGKTVYVLSNDSRTLTPVSTATNTAGQPITLRQHLAKWTTGAPLAAITPDGKTIYVFGNGTVTPVSTATGTARRAINVGPGPIAMVFTPDGKTGYVLSEDNNTSSRLTPISTATNTAGRPIRLGRYADAIAIAP